MKRFVDKVAIVTGGRGGIGQAIAQRLESEGREVFTAQRGVDDRFDHVMADFADPDCPSRVVEEVIARAGRIDVPGQQCRTDTGRWYRRSGIVAMWQDNLMVNLTAPFLMIQSALPALRRTRGSIVNIGSVEGLADNPGHAAYCASRAGIHGCDQSGCH